MAGGDQHLGVVVGVDGSAPSDAAVRWAAREAELHKRRLTVVNATATPALPRAAAPGSEELRPREELASRAILDDAVRIAEDTIKDVGRAEIESQFLHSAPVPTLVDMSKDADMVVVGSRGLGAVRSVVMGSVSTGLIHQAYCPVAVIHHETSLLHPVHEAVLLGSDGSPASELATAIAFEEASLRGARLVALHAWCDTDMAHIPSLEQSALRSAAEETLAERLAGWRERYPDVSVTRIVEYDRPDIHLLEHSRFAQLVVVGSHGRGGFAGMLLGSISTAVAQKARTPVIIARNH